MTNPRTIAKRNERAMAKAGLVFVHGRWLKPEDAARIQQAMDDAAEEVASIRAAREDESNDR